MPNLEYVFVKASATWQRENHPTCSTSSTPSSRDTTTYVDMFDDMLTFEEPLGKIDTVTAVEVKQTFVFSFQQKSRGSISWILDP